MLLPGRELIASSLLGLRRLGARPYSTTFSEGERVLAYWQSLLGQNVQAAGQAEDGHVKELLATAIRLRQGRAQASASHCKVLPQPAVRCALPHRSPCRRRCKRRTPVSLVSRPGAEHAP